MDRYLWTSSFNEKKSLPWSCPSCNIGVLDFDEKHKIVSIETPESISAHDHEDFEPDWVDYVFSAWLICGNKDCRKHVAIIGKGGNEPKYNENYSHIGWQRYYKPAFAMPMPDVFKIPLNSPEDVVNPLRRSFSSFWSDPTSSANSLRTAIENLLNHIKIPRKRKAKSGKFTHIQLHDRIKILQDRNQVLGDQLMAVKWFGNSGSHEESISHEDLLDAYEIVEHALDEILNKRSRRVTSLVNTLSKKHAPRRKK